MPAYATAAEHPGFQDAFGRTRAEHRTILGVGNEENGLQPWGWGLSAFRAGAPHKGKPSRYDADHATVHGRQGSSFYNTSSYFAVDDGGPLVGQCKGAAWGHNTAGHAYLFHKHTGMKAVAA